MSIPRQIAEAKGMKVVSVFVDDSVLCEKTEGDYFNYSPETDKAQAFDLETDIKKHGNIYGWYNDKTDEFIYEHITDAANILWMVQDKDPLTAICKAWLTMKGEG